MRVDELERELRAQRPETDRAFAARLDEWAEAGFPRDRGLGPGVGARAGALRRLWGRFSSTPPRRIALPVGAVATVAVIAGVVITNGDRIGDEGSSDSAAISSQPATDQVRGGTGGGSAGATSESAAPSAATPQPSASDEYNLSIPDAGAGAAAQQQADSGPAGVATGTDDRIVDATARLTLGADADEVQDVANGVVSVTDRYDGVVTDSQVSRDAGGARASFSLQIPFRNLDAALADLSGLADVVSRTEGTKDITAKAVRARKDLANTLDRIRAARVELIKADTREQRLVIKSQIESLQATADAQRTELNGVKREGRFATVDVAVTSNGGGGDDGGWSLGDALDDAGRVLEVIGGVALISLAALIPLGLVGALIAFAYTRGRRRARERALGA